MKWQGAGLGSFLLLGGCLALAPPRAVRNYNPKPAATEKEAVAAVEEWRKAMGMKPFPGKVAPTTVVNPWEPVSKDEWALFCTDGKGISWTFRVSAKSGRVTTANFQPSALTMPSGSARRYVRGEDAMKAIAEIAAPLLKGHEVTLTSFDMGAEMQPTLVGSRVTLFGGLGRGMRAHYSVLSKGLPFFDNSYGIDIVIDPQSGEPISYRENLGVPLTGAPIPLVLPQAAVAAAEADLGLKAGKLAHVSAILGWAVPPGNREARLFYLVDASNAGVTYPPVYISAETGRVDKALGSALWASTGSRYMRYGTYGIVMPGMPAAKSSKPAPAKPAPKSANKKP